MYEMAIEFVVNSFLLAGHIGLYLDTGGSGASSRPPWTYSKCRISESTIYTESSAPGRQIFHEDAISVLSSNGLGGMSGDFSVIPMNLHRHGLIVQIVEPLDEMFSR